jgi:serine protease inhibitor
MRRFLPKLHAACSSESTDTESRKSRSRPVIKEMRVDRPFLFLVFDSTSGLVLCETVVNSIKEA